MVRDRITTVLCAAVVLSALVPLVDAAPHLYPLLRAIAQRDYSTVYRGRHGELLAVTTVDDGIRREYVALNRAPPEVVRTILTAEDKRFYRHNGVDPVAVIRAAARNLQGRRIVSGASTITMQVVRLFSPAASRPGKIRQAVLALWLERFLSKETILELYLSNLPFGSGVAGIESASRRFYGLAVTELTTAEIASMVVIPRNPRRYHPHTGREVNVRAAAALASRMREAPRADEIAAATAAAEERLRRRNPWGTTEAPHFLQYLASGAGTEQRKTPITGTEQQKMEHRTSLDLSMQRMANEALRRRIEGARAHRISHGAILAMDGRTGEVLVWVGSPDFHEPRSGQVDAVLIRRQPGSTLKPFLYAAAMDRGYDAHTILPDLPLDFPGDPLAEAAGEERLYAPRNFTGRFHGPVRLSTALAASLNVPAVYTLQQIGIPVFLEVLDQLQFHSLREHPADWGLGLALGNGEVRLIELVAAYTAFLNRGIPRTPLVHAVLPDETPGTPSPVFSESTTAAIVDILSDPVEGAAVFGARGTPAAERRIVKTGTASQFSNIWAIVASPHHVVGVWMGNVTGETVIGRPGSSIPAALAGEVLDALTGGI